MVLEAVEDEDMSVDKLWEGVRNALTEAADCKIGRNSTVRRIKWMSDETWDKIKKRGGKTKERSRSS